MPALLLHEEQRGLCFVRARHNDEIVLTTYGRSSGFCIDPIEKKPLNHFLPGTPVLSFGTAGCNLTCKFCQNWDISKARCSIACRTWPRRRRSPRRPHNVGHNDPPGESAPHANTSQSMCAAMLTSVSCRPLTFSVCGRS